MGHATRGRGESSLRRVVVGWHNGGPSAQEPEEGTPLSDGLDLEECAGSLEGALPDARGREPLTDLQDKAIRVWLADELKAGIAPSPVHRHYRVLRPVPNVAVETELLNRSPCDAVKAPAVSQQEMRYLTAPEGQPSRSCHHSRLPGFRLRGRLHRPLLGAS